jgi:hypothetical protein
MSIVLALFDRLVKTLLMVHFTWNFYFTSRPSWDVYKLSTVQYCGYFGLYCLRTYIVYPTIIPFVEKANQATFLFIIRCNIMVVQVKQIPKHFLLEQRGVPS